MISVRIFLSLLFTTPYLFWGLSSGFAVWQPQNDDEVQIKMYQTADKTEQWNAVFFVDTNGYDYIISRLASKYDTILFFTIDKSNCPNTGRQFGIRTWPSIVFRRLGNNEVTLVSPDLYNLQGGELENKLQEYTRYDKGIEEFTVYEVFKFALAVADRDGLLVVIYIVNDDYEENEPYFSTVAQLYTPSIKVFKINSYMWTSAEDPYWNTVQYDKGAGFPIIFRKFGLVRHRVFGFNWTTFYELLLKYKDVKKWEYTNNVSTVEVLITDQTAKSSGDLVQYAKNDKDFSLMLKSAEQAEQLIILYIVDNDNYYKDVDKSVEVLKIVFPTISIIKVNVGMCKGVANQYPDKGKAVFFFFPTFIVRKFEVNLARFVGFNAKKLRIQILLYKDIDRTSVKVDEGNQPPISSPVFESNFSEYGRKAGGSNAHDTNRHSKLVTNKYSALPMYEKWYTNYYNPFDPSIQQLPIHKYRPRYYTPVAPILLDVSPLNYGQRPGENNAYANNNNNAYRNNRTNALPTQNNVYASNFKPVGSSIKELPLLTNGSRGIPITPIASISGKYVLTNTCAFDSLTSIIMVAYSDSVKYRQKVDSTYNDYFDFISNVVNNGITQATYTKRAQLIINKTNPIIRNYTVECDTTIYNIVNSLFVDFPTKTDTKLSISNIGSFVYSPIKPNIYITYQTPNGRIENLQDFLTKSFQREDLKECAIYKRISDMHIFIDVFTWNATYSVSGFVNSDITEQVKMRLRDIPKHLVHNSTSYVLRGVVNHRLGASRSLTSSGHYTAYALRGDGTWQLFDDLNFRTESVNDRTESTIELLVYTI